VFQICHLLLHFELYLITNKKNKTIYQNDQPCHPALSLLRVAHILPKILRRHIRFLCLYLSTKKQKLVSTHHALSPRIIGIIFKNYECSTDLGLILLSFHIIDLWLHLSQLICIALLYCFPSSQEQLNQFLVVKYEIHSRNLDVLTTSVWMELLEQLILELLSSWDLLVVFVEVSIFENLIVSFIDVNEHRIWRSGDVVFVISLWSVFGWSLSEEQEDDDQDLGEDLDDYIRVSNSCLLFEIFSSLLVTAKWSDNFYPLFMFFIKNF